LTISIRKAIEIIENDKLGTLENALKANIYALTEIRDNSVHLINKSSDLSKAIQELGTATLQNFVLITKEWFGYDLSKYNFYLMPLAFYRNFDRASGIILTQEEANIAKYLTNLHHSHDMNSEEGKYSVTLELNVRLKRSNLSTAARLALGDNPDAIPVTISEEEINSLYPWGYKELTKRLSDRYIDFIQNSDFHRLNSQLKKDKRYVLIRYLDPKNKTSTKKTFYSSNILNEYDKHYKKS
jgi:hypothetical protein